MSHEVLEVTVRKGGWWWTKKRERWRDSEVAVKKILFKCGWRCWQRRAIWKQSTILGSQYRDSKLPVHVKNPHSPRHRHGWCSGGDILAWGCGRDHPDCKPVRAGPPVQIPIEVKGVLELQWVWVGSFWSGFGGWTNYLYNHKYCLFGQIRLDLVDNTHTNTPYYCIVLRHAHISELQNSIAQPYTVQCQTAKVHQLSSVGNRFFMGKQTPESFSEGLKTSKNTLFLFFPRFFGLDILWTQNFTI